MSSLGMIFCVYNIFTAVLFSEFDTSPLLFSSVLQEKKHTKRMPFFQFILSASHSHPLV